MDCNQNNKPKPSLTFALPQEPFFTPVQLVMLAGKAFEAMAANHVRQAVEGGHNQTVKLLEGGDSSIGRVSKSGGAGLRFPFDVMDHATRTVADNWCVLMGLETTREAQVSEQLKAQDKVFSRREKELLQEIKSLSLRISAKDKLLAEQQTESEKARKAKLSAQRAQRKLKAELEASNETLHELKEETGAATERYDQQQSENKLLQKQKQDAELELAKAKQEARKLKTDSGQIASQLDTLAAENEKLIAEKDGLNKRIEELQRQLEQSSHYTE